jgi:hypothetical protein
VTSHAASPTRPVQAGSICTKHAEVADVRSVRGGLEVRHRNGRTEDAKRGTALVDGDRLITRKQQRALVEYCDSSALYLNQGSEVRLSSAHSARGVKGEALQVTAEQFRRMIGD